MSKKRIYCEVEFIKQLVELPAKMSFGSIDHVNELTLWGKMCTYVMSSDMYLDSIKELVTLAIKKKDKVYMKILKSYTDGHSKSEDELELELIDGKKVKYHFLNDHYPNLEEFHRYKDDNTVMTSTFLSANSSNECEGIQKSYGVVAISIDSVFNSSKYFITKIETISSGDWSHSNWSFMDKLKHPSNSLCFIDAYIFNSENAVNNNLLPILNALLPDSLSVPYHIAIFAQDNISDLSRVIFKSAKIKISTELKELKPDLDVEIGIYRTTAGNFHDRVIITNNLIIESGSGFDLFRPLPWSQSIVGSINKTTVSSHYIRFQVDQTSEGGKKEINLDEFLLDSSRRIYNRNKNTNSSNRLLE